MPPVKRRLSDPHGGMVWRGAPVEGRSPPPSVPTGAGPSTPLPRQDRLDRLLHRQRQTK